MFTLMFLTWFSLYFFHTYKRPLLYKYVATAHLFWNNYEPELLPNLLYAPHQVCLATPLTLAQYYPHRIDCAPGVHISNNGQVDKFLIDSSFLYAGTLCTVPQVFPEPPRTRESTLHTVTS